MEPSTNPLRGAFGTFATGVTVVTVGGADPHGMTANSFTSVSLDPPLVSVSVARQAVMHERITTIDCFGVSVLSAGQTELARYFADSRRPSGAHQFHGVDTVDGAVSGVPLLRGALATLECRRHVLHWGGDHTIVVGEVIRAVTCGGAGSLLFAGGRIHEWCGDPDRGSDPLEPAVVWEHPSVRDRRLSA